MFTSCCTWGHIGHDGCNMSRVWGSCTREFGDVKPRHEKCPTVKKSGVDVRLVTCCCISALCAVGCRLHVQNIVSHQVLRGS